MATAVNDYYKKIVNESAVTQESGLSNFDFQTIDTSVLLSSGLLNNNNNNNKDNNIKNNNNEADDDDCKIISFNDSAPLWTSYMGSLPLPSLPTSISGSGVPIAIAGSIPDSAVASLTMGSLPIPMAGSLPLPMVGSLPTPSIINLEDSTGDNVDVNSCCICNVCNAMFRNNGELVGHLKTHLLKEEKVGFMCILCGNEYRHKYNLKRHLKKVHHVAHDELPRYVDNVEAPQTPQIQAAQIQTPHIQTPQIQTPQIQTEPSADTIDSQLIGGGVKVEEGESSTFYQTVMQLPTPYEHPAIKAEDTAIILNDNASNDCDTMNLLSNIDNMHSNNGLNELNDSDSGTTTAKNNSNSSNFDKNSNASSSNSTTSFDKAPCTICGRSLSNKWSLKRHLHLVHKLDKDADEPPPKAPKILGITTCQTCPICQKQFLDSGVYGTDTAAVALRAHLDECHPLDVTADVTSPSGIFSDIEDPAISMLDVLQ